MKEFRGDAGDARGACLACEAESVGTEFLGPVNRWPENLAD